VFRYDWPAERGDLNPRDPSVFWGGIRPERDALFGPKKSIRAGVTKMLIMKPSNRGMKFEILSRTRRKTNLDPVPLVQ
jgi:hypothetical protein